MWGGVDRLLAEAAVALVDEGHNRFVLLADEGDEVGLAVAVQVADWHVNRPVPRVHSVRHEQRFRPVLRPVLQVDDLPGLAPAEDGDYQIELAVPVEVGHLHVGNTPHVSEERDGRERTVGRATQPNDLSLTLIGREEAPETGHDQVQVAVAIEVHHFGVCRVCQRGQHAPGRMGLVRSQHADLVRARVATEYVQPLRVEQVNEVHVGHPGDDAHVGRPEALAVEPKRHLAGGIFGGRQGQFQRRASLVVADDAISGGIRAGQSQRRIVQEFVALIDFLAPVRAGKGLGRRIGMTSTTERKHLLVRRFLDGRSTARGLDREPTAQSNGRSQTEEPQEPNHGLPPSPKRWLCMESPLTSAVA